MNRSFYNPRTLVLPDRRHRKQIEKSKKVFIRSWEDGSGRSFGDDERYAKRNWDVLGEGLSVLKIMLQKYRVAGLILMLWLPLRM